MSLYAIDLLGNYHENRINRIVRRRSSRHVLSQNVSLDTVKSLICHFIQ